GANNGSEGVIDEVLLGRDLLLEDGARRGEGLAVHLLVFIRRVSELKGDGDLGVATGVVVLQIEDSTLQSVLRTQMEGSRRYHVGNRGGADGIHQGDSLRRGIAP